MVKFNIEDEAGFIGTLNDIGPTAAEEVLTELARIEADNLTWDQFVELHGWLGITLTGDNTYPGADPLYWFVIVGSTGTRYQIAAKGPYDAIVVCSVAVQIS